MAAFPSRDARLSPRCLVSSPAAPSGDVSSPLALSPMMSHGGTGTFYYGAADSSFSAASSSRGHSPFGKSNHSRQSSLNSANSSFHAAPFNSVQSMTNGGGRHFRQRSEPLILEQPQIFHHSRQHSSSTTSGDSLGRGLSEAAVGLGARRKQRQHELSWDKIQAFPPPTQQQQQQQHQQRPPTNFVLGSAPKMMSSPTRSIDMGYHTLNGDNSLSLEPYDSSLTSINLACPSVRDNCKVNDRTFTTH